MIRFSILFTVLLLFTTRALAQKDSLIITSDISLFWKVYDKVTIASDSTRAIQLIQDEYLSKGSTGLDAIKNYNVFGSRDLYKIIRTQQLYLNSIRQSTLNIENNYKDYYAIFNNFKKIYPRYSYPKVYFTIGGMLVGGFNRDDESLVIGTELAVGTKLSKTDSLNSYLKLFTATNPGVRYIVAHEIVHTQQTHGYLSNMNLAGVCIMEGSADFIADHLLNRKNSMPYTIYGKKHHTRIVNQFFKNKLSNEQDILNQWIYNASLYLKEGTIERPDLGYYIGYKICESYYDRAIDKNQAISDILQINYDDKNSVMDFYQKSGFESTYR